MTFNTMPKWWYWYSFIDFLRYSWGALMVNQFENSDIPFTQGIYTKAPSYTRWLMLICRHDLVAPINGAPSVR